MWANGFLIENFSKFDQICCEIIKVQKIGFYTISESKSGLQNSSLTIFFKTKLTSEQDDGLDRSLFIFFTKILIEMG